MEMVELRRKTDEEFVRELDELVGEEYTSLTPYIRSNEHIIMRHNICGNEYNVRPNLFLKGGRCPNCFGNKAKTKTHETFVKEVFDLVGDEYTILTKYTNRVNDVIVRHNVCGREYSVRPHNFLSKSRCVECYYDSLRLTRDEAISKMRSSLDETYELISEYVSLQKLSELRHIKCGTTFKVRLTDVIQKRSGCPKCAMSIGEQQVSTFLDSIGVTYEINKKFDGLEDDKQLSYDFYIPEMNTLIEFQGIQHYMPKTFGGITKDEAIVNFERQKLHDKMKREYAADNGIILLEPNFKLKTYESVANYLTKQLMLNK